MGKEQQKILVVDDERININVLVDLLKPDYKMMFAKNGIQALKAVQKENPPDLVLLDIMMPEMDGYEVCRQLKADEATRDIPVVFVTAMGETSDETKGFELGAVDYITKPISPPVVKARVATHLNLRNTMLELKQLNAELEIKVQERTIDLEKAKEAAELSEKVKSNFLANVSHELKTPLNAVMGYGQILSSKYKDPDALKYLKKINFSTQQLLLIINDLLAMSQMKAIRQKSDFTPLNIKQFFDHLKDMVSIEIEKNALDLILTIDPELPGELLLDEVRLRHILLNLLSNAIKFTQNGSIKMSAIIENFNMVENNIDLKICVEDTGVGISEDFIGQVFDEFKQQDGLSTRKFGGLGLGLSVAKRIANLMGGTITVKSEVNKGSLFEVALNNIEISDKAISKNSEDEEQSQGLDEQKETGSNKVEKKIGDIKDLLNFLVELETYVKKKKPKPCKTIIQQISECDWPGDIADDVSTICHFIKKYKYKDATPVLKSLIGTLEG